RIATLKQALLVKQKKESRAHQLEQAFSELQKLDKQSDGLDHLLKNWRTFVANYPADNPHLDEAKVHIQALEQRGRIESGFSDLMKFHQEEASIEKRISAWMQFIGEFPDNNPYLDEAQAQVKNLKQTLAHQAIDNEYYETLKRENVLSNHEERARLWQTFIDRHPKDNPRLADAAARLNQAETSIALERRFAELSARISGGLESQLEAWLKFVKTYPTDNPHLGEAKTRLADLRKRVMEKKIEEHRMQRIEENFTSLKQAPENTNLSRTQQIAKWQEFINKYPTKNPHFAEAKNRINYLQRAQAIENRLILLKRLNDIDVSLTTKLEEWRGFIEAYPADNPYLDIAIARIHELEKNFLAIQFNRPDAFGQAKSNPEPAQVSTQEPEDWQKQDYKTQGFHTSQQSDVSGSSS
ncbi:MAG: hypothetical protein JSU88_05915, partial [Nitrospinaceae bacterium]